VRGWVMSEPVRALDAWQEPHWLSRYGNHPPNNVDTPTPRNGSDSQCGDARGRETSSDWVEAGGIGPHCCSGATSQRGLDGETGNHLNGPEAITTRLAGKRRG
jgi:hypothetical protein